MDGPSAPRFGLPTSVGGLPFSDHVTAVEFMLEVQAAFPTVPRLRRAHGSLTDQLTSFIPGAAVSETGLVVLGGHGGKSGISRCGNDPHQLDRSAPPRPLTTADVMVDSPALHTLTGPFEGVARFGDAVHSRSLASREDFLGLRIGVLGPVTTALVLRSLGLPLDSALRIGIEISSTISTVLAERMRRIVGSKVVAVVLSEPGLIGAMHPAFPLLCGQVLNTLSTVVDHLDRRHDQGPLLIGVHVPGKTDWSTVIASGVSLISAPVGTNLACSADHLQSFLDAGGTIAWGAVPVDEPLGATDELLWRRLGAFWCSLVSAGIDPFQIRAQSLISTTDGLGHFGVSQTANAHALIDSLATRVRRQAAGTRLSLGA